jgi:hypothetical protein
LADQGRQIAVDVESMRIRPVFTVLLALLIIGVVIGGTVVTAAARADHHNLVHAQTVAHNLLAPAGATTSSTCHADGLVSCWVVKGSAVHVASTVSAGLTGPAGKAPAQSCQQVPVGSQGSSVTTDECSVIVRYGDHGVFAFFDPQVSHDADGRATITGTLVTVSTA